MELTTFIVFLCLIRSQVDAEYRMLSNVTSLILRDNIFSKRCSGTCEECFGTGMVPCVGLICFDPSAGESCCESGNYCPAGQTCTNIEGGCCNNGQSVQDCAASLGVPVPSATTSASSTAPSPNTSQGSSNSASDTDTAGHWVTTHKGVIIGAAAGAAVLFLLLVCFGIYRRRTRLRRVHPASDAPSAGPMVYDPTGFTRPGQYTYSGSGCQYGGK